MGWALAQWQSVCVAPRKLWAPDPSRKRRTEGKGKRTGEKNSISTRETLGPTPSTTIKKLIIPILVGLVVRWEQMKARTYK